MIGGFLRIQRDVTLLTAKRNLDRARAIGDRLQIELAEAALNDLLDRFTGKTRETEDRK